MKKVIFSLVVIGVTMALTAQSSGTTLYVAAKTVEVKTSSSFFASSLGTLTLGESVVVQMDEGKWLVIRNSSGLQGWAPADAFSLRRIISSGANISPAEVSMAGKGFNEALERTIRSSGERDYSLVDAMEKRNVSLGELQSFLREGRLAEGD